MKRVYFIDAFRQVDYTENPETMQRLSDCGNAFETEEDAYEELQRICG